MTTFRIYCDCGPGGTKREVLATRKNGRTSGRWFSFKGTKSIPVNICLECGKEWPALHGRRQKTPKGQAVFQF